MFHIVDFKANHPKEKTVVPDTWLSINNTLCALPPNAPSKELETMAQNRVEPGPGWQIYGINLLQTFETYTEAKKELEKSKETTDVGPQRKRKKPGYLSDYSSQDLDNGHASFPTTIFKTEYDLDDLSENEWVPSSQVVMIPVDKEKESTDKNVINGNLATWMADISDKVQQLEAKIDLVLKNQAKLLQQKHQVPENLDRNEDLEILRNLPVTDDNSFVEINKKIADNHLRHLLVKILISVGGRDMRCHIHNMLRRLLSDDVAELYTLKGKSTLKNVRKKSFLDTEFSKAIFSACQIIFKDTATEIKMKEAMGDWLNQAKVRKSRRMQRHEKNMEKNEE